MKNLKLFEGFLRDMVEYKKPKQFDEISKELKSEIDMFMFEILDEYQTSSEDDVISTLSDNSIRISYKNIFVNFEDIEDFVNKYNKIIKVFKSKYGLLVNTFYSNRFRTFSASGNPILVQEGPNLDIQGNLNKLVELSKSGKFKSNSIFKFTIHIIDFG